MSETNLDANIVIDSLDNSELGSVEKEWNETVSKLYNLHAKWYQLYNRSYTQLLLADKFANAKYLEIEVIIRELSTAESPPGFQNSPLATDMKKANWTTLLHAQSIIERDGEDEVTYKRLLGIDLINLGTTESLEVEYIPTSMSDFNERYGMPPEDYIKTRFDKDNKDNEEN